MCYSGRQLGGYHRVCRHRCHDCHCNRRRRLLLSTTEKQEAAERLIYLSFVLASYPVITIIQLHSCYVNKLFLVKFTYKYKYYRYTG